jgi:hypothetical protein
LELKSGQGAQHLESAEDLKQRALRLLELIRYEYSV